MISGQINGVKKSYIKELESLYDCKLNKNFIADEELLRKICEISLKLNKEICVVISRNGSVHNISIGTESEAEFQSDFKERKKLSGYRIIHTHLNSSCRLSSIDVASLKNLKLDAISAVNVTGKKLMESFSIGFLNYDNVRGYTEVLFDNIHEYLNFDIYSTVHEIEKNLNVDLHNNESFEVACLIGCDSEESLEELKELAYACNVDVQRVFFQKRDKIDKAYYVGKGKLHEILRSIYNQKIDILIFDEELSPSQVSNLEEISKIKVLDRTNLILEIFARRAKSKVSKYQVELAQLKHRYSRLKGLGIVLSRTGGGIGTRGPGEKKLETDRRHIKNRINYLQEQIKIIKTERCVQRDLRIRNRIPQVSIVGYTNAGKSTLRNCVYSIYGENFSESKFVYEEDMLFATLDTTTRKIILPNKAVVSLTDTVGFIKKLPHDLVEAFKSTLEEVVFSDLILHLVDVSSSTWRDEIQTTDSVLREIGMVNFDRIFVFNKIDRLQDQEFEKIKKDVSESFGDDVVFISATKKLNIDSLLRMVEEKLDVDYKNISVSIPYSDYSVLSSIYDKYTILEEKHLDNSTFLNFNIHGSEIKKYKKYIINGLEK